MPCKGCNNNNNNYDLNVYSFSQNCCDPCCRQQQYPPRNCNSPQNCCGNGCNCCCCKPLAKGRFGLAWVVESPCSTYYKPCGWQIEFEGTPSKVDQKCCELAKWANCPPVVCCTPECEGGCALCGKKSTGALGDSDSDFDTSKKSDNNRNNGNNNKGSKKECDCQCRTRSKSGENKRDGRLLEKIRKTNKGRQSEIDKIEKDAHK